MKKILTTSIAASLSIIAINFNAVGKDIITNEIINSETIDSDKIFNDRVTIGEAKNGGGSLTIKNAKNVYFNDALDVGWGHHTTDEGESDLQNGKPSREISESVLNIEDGSIVNINKKKNYALSIGGSNRESLYSGYGTGIVNIDGKGTLLKIDKGDVLLGASNGNGILNITNGASLELNEGVGQRIELGRRGNYHDTLDAIYGPSTGLIFINKGTLSTQGSIYVGYNSVNIDKSNPNKTNENNLLLNNNSTVNVNSLIAGESALSKGLISVDNNSTINANAMTIGKDGFGLLQISNGSNINVTGNILVGFSTNNYAKGYIYIGSDNRDTPITPGEIKTQNIIFKGQYSYLVFNHTSSDYNFTTQLKSELEDIGHVEFINGKTTISNDNNDFSGDIDVYKNATLSLGSQYSTGKAKVTNDGTLLVNKEKTIENINNTGTIYLSDKGIIGSTLTINENYSGGGTLVFNSKLGDDNSTTDKLVIKGEATGTTNVVVNNVGGNGASTINGIELITTGGSSSDTFQQKGRIVAGTYDYYLHRGESKNSNNWYLKSELSESNPKPEPEPIIRPEVGSYISNLQAAGTIFNTTLKDRQGGGTYINPVTGEVYTSSLWMRSIGGHQKAKINSQSDYTANKFVYQMGGDIINGSLQDNNEYHLGIMAGYGNQHNKSHNKLSGYKSKGALWGYSTGLYGTWYQNGKTNTRLYVDSWLLYNWFNNSVSGDELAYENYKSKGFTASIESGYAFNIASFPSFGDTVNNVYLTPQAQAIWSGVKADKHKESNGTEVKALGNNNIQTRVGLRLSMANEGSPLKDLPIRPLMPFIEANWQYTSKQYGVSMNNENTYIQGSRNVGEVKAGLEADLNHNVTLWGNVAQQFGSHSYQNTQGMLGVKYAF